MRRSLLIIALVLAAAAPAQADTPNTRIVGILGGRLNTGDLGNRYQLGYVYGAEAGYQWDTIGVAWTLLGGVFDSTRTDNTAAELRLVEMGFSLRARFPLGGGALRTFLVTQLGVDIVRSSIPLAPSDTRSNIGPTLGTGVEFIIADQYLINLGLRYGLFPDGPSGLTLFLSLGLGRS